jgi:hypothetical protein
MRTSVLSAGLLSFARPARSREKVAEEDMLPVVSKRWDADRFANEQIRGLVRRVFDPDATPALRQIVFSAIDPDTNVLGVCRRVAECLASETSKEVAIVTSDAQPTVSEAAEIHRQCPIPRRGTRLLNNVWLVSVDDLNRTRSESLKICLEEARRAFDYSIIAASPSEVQDAGQVADGLILVLSALRTRRASARQFRDALSHVRLLGTVLSDREFPIPEGIYRSL